LRLIGNSAAALTAFLGFQGALSKTFDVNTRNGSLVSPEGLRTVNRHSLRSVALDEVDIGVRSELTEPRPRREKMSDSMKAITAGMQRRTFLGTLTTASLGVVLNTSIIRPGRSQAELRVAPNVTGQLSFETSKVKVSGNTIFVRRYGKGPAILMVHGFPRTSLMWRFLAPKLAKNHTLICADLRAYGQSGIPESADDHFPYSKRAMANELLELMMQLGFPSFTLLGHDRGGRVSYRLALDHPSAVVRLAVFDVIPILEAWARSDARFAQTYWPWILLSQKAPLPESYLLGAPEAVFHNPFGQGSFGREVLDEYIATYRDPARVHGICEEYRAAATIDVEHDRADKQAGKRIECPMLHLWAQGGPLDTFYAEDGGPLGIWRQWAPHAEGHAMKGGHFFPEENPDDTAALVTKFLST
jgi:haloacetate dehalogenase